MVLCPRFNFTSSDLIESKNVIFMLLEFCLLDYMRALPRRLVAQVPARSQESGRLETLFDVKAALISVA